MEPTASFSELPEFPKPAVDAAADGDKFDELPEAVIHHIFSFLEIQDVMRACAVSKYWRYLWTSMPCLDLNRRAAGIYSYDKFKDFVNWVLMTHDESVSIQSCRLQCSNDEDDNSIYRWLHKLATKRVRKLCLDVCDGENPFVLPICLLASDSLEVLEIELQCCVLKIPSWAGFSRLQSLRLTSIELLDQNLFRNLISSCPLLKKLTLEDCGFPDVKVVDISSRTLRKLDIATDGYEESDALRERHLKITCPNLVVFRLYGTLKSLSWGENPCFLQKALLNLDMQNEVEVLNDRFSKLASEILKGVCHVEILKLRMNFLKCFSPAVAKPGCFCTMFYNLKTLTLRTDVEECTQSIIYLLKSAPNLQLLSVNMRDKKDSERDYKCKMLDEDIECLTCHLKMVKLINLDDSDAELELIRFFLKNAHVVEKMSIIWGFWLDGETEREDIQKVMKFPRSSSQVNVTFFKQKRLSPYHVGV